ncbi:MAG: hypothetical protein SGILL_004747 [Bacillariaceae sp.]
MGDHRATAEELHTKVNKCLLDIDQLLIPSTINNFINRRFVLKKEKEIIQVFLDCDATTLNYLVCHVKLALLVYKIKDHGFGGQHRTEIIQLFAVERLPALTIMSRVIVLHALQVLDLRANPRAEYWVRNIFLSTQGDDLSELKSLTDAKGDYYSMSKLVYDDIRSESVRQDILAHFRKEGAMQVARRQHGTVQRGNRRRYVMSWKKILSDVDDTLLSSGGLFPAGVDERYPRKVVYPGVLAFYRELDLGTTGPEDWPEERVGNLVFLSARPHMYKDMSEKANFVKFEKMRIMGENGRRGMHTTPSLLAGDMASGTEYMRTFDFKPLALKKFDNFKRYVSIYPEYTHLFVCDNGQGDVSAGEMMHDNFPYEYQATYVHVVQDIPKTYGYDLERWHRNEYFPCFFTTYPEAALHAATQNPPLIRMTGLQRVCADSVRDFYDIPEKKWKSYAQKADRRTELNQALWTANKHLAINDVDTVELVQAEQLWNNGEKVKTPYGNGTILGFNSECDLYTVEIDWRPLDVQIDEHLRDVKEQAVHPKQQRLEKRASMPLETVVESDEVPDDEKSDVSALPRAGRPSLHQQQSMPVALVETKEEDFFEGDLNRNGSNAVPSLAMENEQGEALSNSENRHANSTVSDMSSVSSIDSNEGSPQNGSHADAYPKVTAAVSGRSITKFVPPALPSENRKSSPYFWFGTGSPAKFAPGEKCTTPYGPAVVVQHRVEDKIVVVEMVGWSARAYMHDIDIKVTKESLLASLFRRQISSTEPVPKHQQFPYVVGTVIHTPFGEAEVIVPIPTPDEDPTNKLRDHSDEIVCLGLTSWRLANESHPKVYATVKTCQMWKDAKEKGHSSTGLFSAFGRLVSTIDREIKDLLVPPKPKDVDLTGAKQQYYQESAAVSTAYGDGRVKSFRESDSLYSVSLSNWTLADGRHAVAWLREQDIRTQIAKGCKEGYPVLTHLGVTGILESVQPKTGIHIVTASSHRMILYLQPLAIVRPLKAAVGEDVLTAFGEGKVMRYGIDDDTYEIQLSWGARMFSKAETFDRVRDSMRNKAAIGMNWLLGFFFSPTEEKKGEPRSRSNSVASASVRSQAGAKSTAA